MKTMVNGNGRVDDLHSYLSQEDSLLLSGPADALLAELHCGLGPGGGGCGLHVEVHVNQQSNQLGGLGLAQELGEGSDHFDHSLEILGVAVISILLANLHEDSLLLLKLLLVPVVVLLLGHPDTVGSVEQLTSQQFTPLPGQVLLGICEGHGRQVLGSLYHHCSSHV